MSTTVEKIKDKLDIVEIVGTYVELHKAGANYKARCPFHNERTPSFIVTPSRGTFYCFGCHAKGDIFSFVEQIEGLDFKSAMKLLAERAGVEIEKEDPRKRSENERLYSALEYAKAFFVSNLEANAEAKEYLSRRGIKDATAKEWGIGWAKEEWRALQAYLNGKKFTNEELEKVGLIKKKEGVGARPDERHYDTFRGRVVFPISDASGKVVGFSGRTLSKDPNIPKYLNSPETVLFNKSELLHGLSKAKASIRKKDYSILVEGQMDLIMCHQAGYSNAVAASGTALTVGHLERLSKLSNRILMAYDSDAAGVAAAQKNARTALAAGMEVKIAELPKGKDPADLILEAPKKWVEALKGSKHVIDFQLDLLMRENSDKRKIAVELKNKVLPFIADLPSAIEQAHYVSAASKRTGIREESIWEDLKNAPKNHVPASEAKPARKSAPAMFSVEKRIMGILYLKPELDEFRKQVIEIGGEDRYMAMKDETAEQALDLTYETEQYYEGKDILVRDLRELLLTFERKCVLEKVADLRDRMRETKEGEIETSDLTEMTRLSKRLEEIKRSIGA